MVEKSGEIGAQACLMFVDVIIKVKQGVLRGAPFLYASFRRRPESRQGEIAVKGCSLDYSL